MNSNIRNKYIIDQYNPIHCIKRSLILKEVNKLAATVGVLHIADIGCGFGTISQELAKIAKIDAYDNNAQIIVFIKKIFSRLANPHFYLESLFTIKKGNYYDMVVCSEVLQYMKDDVMALKKINMILKPHGNLILTVPFNKNLTTEFDKRENSRRYSLEEIVNKLLKANFKIKKIRYWGYPLLKYFYLKVYIPRSNHEAAQGIKKYEFSKIILLLLKFARYFFLVDLLFNSKKAFGLLVVAEKK